MNVSPTVKKKWKFFYELKKCFCHLVPQIKQCFGRTSFDVFTKVLASSRTMFRRRWSFLVTKRLLKDEKGLFFRHYESFLLKNISFTLATDFVHRKKNVFTTQCCFEKRTWKWQWKNTKSFPAKSSRILEHFFDLSWENEEISKNIYCVLFGEMKLVETLSLLIDTKLKQISNAQKKN